MIALILLLVLLLSSSLLLSFVFFLLQLLLLMFCLVCCCSASSTVFVLAGCFFCLFSCDGYTAVPSLLCCFLLLPLLSPSTLLLHAQWILVSPWPDILILVRPTRNTTFEMLFEDFPGDTARTKKNRAPLNAVYRMKVPLFIYIYI